MHARRRVGNAAFAAYAAGVGGLLAVMADETLDLRKWKQVTYEVQRRPAGAATALPPLTLSVNCRTRPPPIGCMEWPAGRVLLQWALDEAGLGEHHEGDGGVVLELGAGIGITAIGLAMARQQASCGAAHQVVATDICTETLKLLRSNADAHGLSESALRVAPWDAARGEESLRTLPCRLEDVRHVLGADVIYYGFGVNNPSDNSTVDAPADAGAPSSGNDHSSRQPVGEPIGFPHTLACLLRERPSLQVSLLVVDRFSGGAVAAVAAMAGEHQPSTTIDPAITRFVRGCEEQGLVVERTPLPPAVLATVQASQSILSRALWWLAGHYDGMAVLRVTRAAVPKYVRVPEGVHEGVGCDRTGRVPLVGNRYSLLCGDDTYDLCEAEFVKLTEAEQRRFTKVPPPSYYMRRPSAAEEDGVQTVPIRWELPGVVPDSVSSTVK